MQGAEARPKPYGGRKTHAQARLAPSPRGRCLLVRLGFPAVVFPAGCDRSQAVPAAQRPGWGRLEKPCAREANPAQTRKPRPPCAQAPHFNPATNFSVGEAVVDKSGLHVDPLHKWHRDGTYGMYGQEKPPPPSAHVSKSAVTFDPRRRAGFWGFLWAFGGGTQGGNGPRCGASPPCARAVLGPEAACRLSAARSASHDPEAAAEEHKGTSVDLPTEIVRQKGLHRDPMHNQHRKYDVGPWVSKARHRRGTGGTGVRAGSRRADCGAAGAGAAGGRTDARGVDGHAGRRPRTGLFCRAGEPADGQQGCRQDHRCGPARRRCLPVPSAWLRARRAALRAR